MYIVWLIQASARKPTSSVIRPGAIAGASMPAPASQVAMTRVTGAATLRRVTDMASMIRTTAADSAAIAKTTNAVEPSAVLIATCTTATAAQLLIKTLVPF